MLKFFVMFLFKYILWFPSLSDNNVQYDDSMSSLTLTLWPFCKSHELMFNCKDIGLYVVWFLSLNDWQNLQCRSSKNTFYTSDFQWFCKLCGSKGFHVWVDSSVRAKVTGPKNKMLEYYFLPAPMHGTKPRCDMLWDLFGDFWRGKNNNHKNYKVFSLEKGKCLTK